MAVADKLDIGSMTVDIFRMCNQDKPFLVKMMAHLEKSFFDSRIFSKVFLIYKLYFDKYQKAPTEKVLSNELVKSGEDPNVVSAVMADIYGQTILNAGEKDYITDLVVTHSRKQKMREAIEKAHDTIDDGGDFTDEKYHDILNNMKDSVKFSIDTELGVDLYDIDERYAKIALALQDKISSGYNQIDHYTGGGFARKELIAIQAPPGIGKCNFSTNLVDIEIDDNDPLYEKIKHLFIEDK